LSIRRRTIEGASFSWFLTPGQINSEIFIADANGANEINLSNSAAFDGWPRFSPDGRWIVFASNRAGPAGVGQLYLIKPDGSELRRVTDGPCGKPKISGPVKLLGFSVVD
jgi:TolB protein